MKTSEDKTASTIDSIISFLERSEQTEKQPFAYEIQLVSPTHSELVVGKCADHSLFRKDVKLGLDRLHSNPSSILKVMIFSGKSANAKLINEYKLELPEQKEAANLRSIIQEELRQHQPQPTPSNNFEQLGSLLGMMTGNQPNADDPNSSLLGFLGFFNTMSAKQEEISRINHKNELSEIVLNNKYEHLTEKYENLKRQYDQVEKEKDRLGGIVEGLDKEKIDLENRLASYAPNEVMQRVATGVLTNVGAKLLTNSPKAASLLGLSDQELKAAFGIGDSVAEAMEQVPIKAEPTDQQSQIIASIQEALQALELDRLIKITQIIGAVIDRPEQMEIILNLLQDEKI
ncbi:hypothetical protein [Persicobacter psychrovividus]|uniref:Flagellar motor switch protein FliG C-terminal domain-containing protein n=1 Tax=Persicobacter psychrovividus TaxID=387638 RepID=A0ABM7VN66_9BACT|nr:hypothetical protein PEPS_47470 [Persicobacter psychrovividus]